ncbi:LacI family DNA-binding transcriptional regulator [Streptococcus sp. DD12]|uniref:LacI family DNA-binding transcriptional regulator n=1 Tax=Streptococcus sp. DD12 TaxID=1777880 RepID=UPI000791F85F|nr:LacI family DNA-binding transcriptional regulator [Streptococcus sp. DD12]KXT75449.1 Maltose operon transcriptional repressor MalR, LacI family [Streptococcus sp. DD12]
MVTIKDVAKRAGVNPSTVSRSLKDSKSISEKTKAKVRQAMEDLGYVPNVAASQLASGLTQSVGVIFPPSTSPDRLTQPFFMEILTAINDEAKKRHFAIAIGTGDSAQDLKEQVALMHKQKLVDGFIVLYTEKDDPVSHYLQENHIPFVSVGQAEDGVKNRSFVDNDNALMAQEAVDYLVSKGHERILFVTPSETETLSQVRYAGYVKGMQAHALSPLAIGLFAPKNPETIDQLGSLIKSHRITAVIALDDLLALRLMQLLSFYDLAVPDDVSILSFNNSLYAKILHPYLTTYDIGVAALGQESLTHLLKEIAEKTADPQQLVVPFALKERESVRDLRK